jgi:Holliday junction resolvase RusA-like endonuclease
MTRRARAPAPLPGVPAPPVGRTLLLVLPEPCAASHARFGNGHGYHDEKYAAWREAAAALIAAKWPWATIPAHTPVALRLVYLSPRPVKRPDWCPALDWNAGGRLYRPTRPDVENFDEAIFDALQPGKVTVAGCGKITTRGVLADDACIVRLTAEDFVAARGEAPAVHVRLTVLPSLLPGPEAP